MKYKQEQIDISKIPIDKTVNKNRKARAKWRNGMQSYCDRQQRNGRAEKDGWCACGYMNFCSYCNGADIAKACVDSIEEMCNEKKISIDYSQTNYERQIKEFER